MDRLPLVPKCEEVHDVLPILTEVFQDVLRAPKYPFNVADNYKKYNVDADYKSLQATGLPIFKILDEFIIQQHSITMVEEEMMWIHAMAIIQKHQNQTISEELKHKRCSVFRNLSKKAVEVYDLIQKSDLFVNHVQQHLDFTFNPLLHTCEHCLSQKPAKTPNLPTKKKRCKQIRAESKEKIAYFSADPDKITFHNYQLGQTYKEKFKIRNITDKPQLFYYTNFPKESNFALKMLSPACRLAPGMCAEFLVTFRSQSYKDCTEFITFKSPNGVDLSLPVSNTRDPPRLTCYVVNSLLPLHAVKQPPPGSKHFSETRRSALNSTIDCGTCLIGTYSLVTIIVKNEGQKGQFLVATEDEWCYSELKADGTRSFELTQGCFTIFPSLFEIDEGEVSQIFVLFVPENVELYTEKFFLICDNNSHQEMEIMGDCIAFCQTLLTINMYLIKDTFSFCNRTVNITLAPHQMSGFILSIINKSPVNFNYFWALKYEAEPAKNEKIDPDWIEIINSTRFLPSLSTTDVVVRLTPKTEKKGTYGIYLSLYLKNIPEPKSLSNPEPSGTRAESIPSSAARRCSTQIHTNFKLTDMHIFELGIFCWVQPVEKVPEPVIRKEEEKPKTEYQKLGLSPKQLDFGVVPKGVQVVKHFHVKNLTNEEIMWQIYEIHFKDKRFRLSSPTGNLSCSDGILEGNSGCKITYTIDATECTRWISILLLFSCPACSCEKLVMEGVCLVLCRVAENKVSIRTDNNLAVLCPKEFIYIGISSHHTVYVHNAGELTGCFYFLKPRGNDSDKVQLKLEPQSGVVPPGATVEVKVELTALEGGIFEDIYVPCFIGDLDKLISLRVLCSATSINVHFYLPNRDEGYVKHLWPPKSEMPTWNYETTATGEGSSCGGEESNVFERALQPVSVDDIFLEITTSDTVVATYPITRSQQVSVKKPTKLTFYVENLTPIAGHFTVYPTNYGPESECVNHILVKAKRRSPEFYWDKACLDGYGIVVEPVRPSGDIVPYEMVELNLWIYANTWGKYLEEMIVEINDLTPFCFNLVIEVLGLPIEFPFARNTILPCPTLRFENISYAVDDNTKSFAITNISAIPVEISWYIFTKAGGHEVSTVPFNFLLEFNEDKVEVCLAKDFYGCEACGKCVNVNPCILSVEKQSTAMVSVKVSSMGYVPSYDKTSIHYDLIGFVGIRDCDKFKANYFKRDSGRDLTPARVEVLVTIELPVMEVDVSSDETTIDVFVNDILLHNYKIPEAYLILRNVDKTCINFSVGIEKPFEITATRTVPSGITDKENLVLQRHECLQVMIACHFSSEDLLQYADLIYQHEEDGDKTENFVSVVGKDFNIYQKGTLRQMIPFQVRLHYPHIEVKPLFIKFGHCLIYRSKKSIFSIYNMTGSSVTFEIFKTVQCEDFEVYPNHGNIPKSTGANKQFVDVAVYFTPRHCKLYLECLRILTNIPQYYIDLPVGGHGSNDEKFY